jgi:hypothetical protein
MMVDDYMGQQMVPMVEGKHGPTTAFVKCSKCKSKQNLRMGCIHQKDGAEALGCNNYSFL